jgi:hypothetical protein
MQYNMSAEGGTRNLRCGSAVQDLVQPSDETKVNKDWGEELGGLIKEVLRRRVRAPWWGGADAEGEIPEQVAEVNEVARGNGVQLQDGVGQEEMLRQNAVETALEASVPSVSRNSLLSDAVPVGDATGQDHVEGESMGGQDLLQTRDQPDLNLTPVQHQHGGPALDVSPVQPDAVVPGNQDPAGEEFLPQEQSLSHSNGQQAGEETHVSEFALLVGFLLFLFGCAFVLMGLHCLQLTFYRFPWSSCMTLFLLSK